MKAVGIKAFVKGVFTSLSESDEPKPLSLDSKSLTLQLQGLSKRTDSRLVNVMSDSDTGLRGNLGDDIAGYSTRYRKLGNTQMAICKQMI